MSEIEDFVLGELRKEREMIFIERGFAWQRGEDVTRVWFKPTAVPPRTPGKRRLPRKFQNYAWLYSSCWFINYVPVPLFTPVRAMFLPGMLLHKLHKLCPASRVLTPISAALEAGYQFVGLARIDQAYRRQRP